jgi:Protein of unknown function (DUF3443)
VRRIFIFAIAQLLLLAACGGGSGDGLLSSGNSGSSSGGSSSGGSNTITPLGPANVVAMSVDAGPQGAGTGIFNIPYVSVTVCVPGSTTNCQTIDHVEVDTGSYGVRIISSAITNSALLAALPQEQATTGGALVECTEFGDGITWGSMRTADVTVGGEKAANIPINIIGDPNYPNISSECLSHGAEEDTVALFGANGILGVGTLVQDCPTCTGSTQNNVYFSCPSGGGACTDVDTPLNLQTTNPVASFTTDNNGVILELPAVGDTGAATVSGVLVFGIGTESNNGLGSATVITTDSVGDITINFNNVQYADAFIDSGSNLNFIVDNAVTTCGTSPNQVFCPSSELSVSATNIGLNNTQSVVNFKIGDATTLFNNNPTYAAFDNVAAPNPDPQGFDFGLPFFYGRNVFTAIQGMNTSGGVGPYFAY